jgi:hypothetical protein
VAVDADQHRAGKPQACNQFQFRGNCCHWYGKPRHAWPET